MRKILLIALLAACASAATIPMLGFDQTAYAQTKKCEFGGCPPPCPVDQDGNDDCQGNEG
jgi:hypothetical protein